MVHLEREFGNMVHLKREFGDMEVSVATWK